MASILAAAEGEPGSMVRATPSEARLQTPISRSRWGTSAIQST